VPALRERKEDIPRLVAHFIEKLGKRTNPAVRGIADPALARLCAYQWPGNVRELENVVEQALVFAEGELVDVAALPEMLRGGASDSALAVPAGDMSLTEILEDLERQLIQKAYDKSGGVKTETARLLGIKTSALYYKLEKYGIGVIESRSGAGGGAGASASAGDAAGEAALLQDGPALGAGGDLRSGKDDRKE